MQSELFKRFSENATVLKFFAILLVSFGHYLQVAWPDGPLTGKIWIPVSGALVLFAFTSGYFTAWKHADSFNFRSFWKKKLLTMGVSYTLVNVFLGLLFFIRSKENIISLDSLLCWLGVKGFLVWFGFSTQTPYGAGLWFFTLLLLFYLFFPLVVAASKCGRFSWVFLVLFLFLIAYCDITIYLGHMLWITMASFVLGTFFCVHRIVLGLRACILVSVGGGGIALASKIFAWGVPTSLMILVLSVALISLMFHLTIPRMVRDAVAPLAGTILGIYLLHTYLFVFLTGIVMVDFIVSTVLTIIIAYGLSFVSGAVSRKLMSH